MGWREFWDGLNIRKLALLVLLSLYGSYMWISGEDLGIRDMLLMAISYYFGYSNGAKHPEEKKQAGKDE